MEENVIEFPPKKQMEDDEEKPDAAWLGGLLIRDADKIEAVASIILFNDGSLSIATTDINLEQLVMSNKFLDTFVTEQMIEKQTYNDDEEQ